LELYFNHNYLVKDDQIIVADCIFSRIEGFNLILENNPKYDNWFLFQRFLSLKDDVVQGTNDINVSILMPIYNGIEFIDESVCSIIEQTYKNWELLIGINGHPENSEIYKIAKKYESIDSRIKVYDFPHLKGKSPTLNEMVTLCKANYIALLDVDDLWSKHKLEAQSKHFGKYDVIGTKCIYFGDKNGVVPDLPVGHINNFNFFKFNPIINSSAVIRKELCNWDHEWNGVEDYNLWLQLWKKEKQFFNCDIILVKHRIHNTSAFNATGNHLKVSDLLKKYK
jgi:glycosyltransferase involved in cell wall biosynthesis